MNVENKSGLNYKDAGVDIVAGNALIERIKPIAAKTRTAGVMAGLGGFGSLFELPLDRYKNPVLVSGTDGVGTKLKLAIDSGIHNTVGIDLVAMCVNDIIVQGAEPLFFLDYFATGKLDVDTAASVIEGIGKGCELAGAALVGGETADVNLTYMMEPTYRSSDVSGSDGSSTCFGRSDPSPISAPFNWILARAGSASICLLLAVRRLVIFCFFSSGVNFPDLVIFSTIDLMPSRYSEKSG